jgi:CRP-like cAMP-binding protein
MASVFSPIDDMPVESCSIGREGAVNLITVMGGGRSFTSCVMQVAGEASCLEAGAWKALCKRSESLEGVALRYAHASWTHALQLAACNSRHSLEQRFARKLLACSVLLDSNEVRLTQAFLADALGVQRTSIVKVASALQDSGIVRYRAGVITILHRRRLTSVSCGCFQLIADTYRRIYLNQALNA